METREMIRSRKAVRHYSGQITDEQLNQILVAANAGPVGMGEYENYRRYYQTNVVITSRS